MPLVRSAAQPLSKLLVPLSRTPKDSTSVDLLNLHGFVRQVGSGIYDLLPLGLRVQSKIENIIRKHLNQAECTELVLSTLVNPGLWQASGRLTSDASKEFTFTEGKKHLLAPTGEEQITTLVGSVSYRQLPLSLYQISRKFRNELRPRGGLLRTREFIMKDLYTFDSSEADAAQSYERIKRAYINIFQDFGIPFTIAEADSGDMGGDLSHEYHYMCGSGEDHIVSCSNASCGYNANVEKAVSRGPSTSASVVVKDAVIPEGRTLSEPLLRMARSNNKKLVDWRLDSENGVPLVEPVTGESCTKCGSELKLETGIEIGHTFYLGDRYSKPLKAHVSLPSGEITPIRMGCYGIGVTRIIGAVAEKLKDAHGLVWPVSIAPFSAIVVSKDPKLSREIADELGSYGIEAAFEDRTTQIGHGMRAARESGIPFTIVLGRSWDAESLIEIMPRSGESIKVPREDLPMKVQELVVQGNKPYTTA